MPIGGSATEFNITGAKLKVSGGVQVTGSIAYTTDATGFGGVTAQIDGNNTLNVTSGKLTGVTKIDRSTAATITAITHTNVNNNTTIHIALKNTSTTRGVFITLGTFASDDTVKVNYTDDYLIGPGETGMLTLRKVNGVLSLFAREMFSDKASTFTDDNTNGNRPFYIKDGVNYKYPLYKYTASGLTSEVIQGTTYFRPTAGITTKTRPPKGIPENVTPPSASGFAIGNNGDMTTLEYSVLGVSSNFDYASITDGNNATHARFLLTDGEASGTFTESGASSGDSYKLFIEKTNTNLTDTVSATSTTPSSPFAVFHHGTFANGGDPYSHGSVTAAATAGYFYSDTATGSYELGTLDETPTFVQETAAGGDGSGKTTYKFTFPDLTSVDHLLVAGGGGGGGDMGGGGGAGGYLETTGTTISGGQKTIVVGGGGYAGAYTGTASYRARGRNGTDTSVTGLTTAIGGGGGATGHNNSDDIAGGNGGSGGGGSGGRNENGSYGELAGSGTSGQGFGGAESGNAWYAGGGGGASQMGYGRGGTGGGVTSIGHGGDGKQSTITGFTSYWFAGGGGCAGHSTSGGNGGKGGGGGGGKGSATYGTGDTNGLTNGGNGDDGTASDSQEGPSNRAGGDGGKHTGGGGGGAHHHTNNWGGHGGSGIVIIRTGGTITTGKKIPKITGISNVTTTASKTINYTFNTQGTGIDKITYKIGSGSEVSTASGVYTLAYTPADFGTTVLTYAYPINSSSTKIGPNFGPYSVATKQSTLGHISPAILLFLSMGTTVTDSVNSVAFTTASGSFTYDTTNNAITNSSSARMKLDFTSVRTDRATAISAFYEFYLPSGTQYEYAASLGGVHDTTGNNNDAIGWYGGTTPTTHYYGNGTQELPTQYNYSNYHGKWVKLGWVREANGNNFKTYIDGVLASTHTPSDGSLTGTGVLSYFYLFRHACNGNENNYTTNDAISFRNLEIYQASFTDAQILAAYGS